MLTLGQLPRVRPIRLRNMDVAGLTTCWPGNEREFLSGRGQRGRIQIQFWHAGLDLLGRIVQQVTDEQSGSATPLIGVDDLLATVDELRTIAGKAHRVLSNENDCARTSERATGHKRKLS